MDGWILVGGLMNGSIEKEGEKLFPDRGDNFRSDEAGGDCSYLVGACFVWFLCLFISLFPCFFVCLSVS